MLVLKPVFTFTVCAKNRNIHGNITGESIIIQSRPDVRKSSGPTFCLSYIRSLLNPANRMYENIEDRLSYIRPRVFYLIKVLFFISFLYLFVFLCLNALIHILVRRKGLWITSGKVHVLSYTQSGQLVERATVCVGTVLLCICRALSAPSPPPPSLCVCVCVCVCVRACARAHVCVCVCVWHNCIVCVPSITLLRFCRCFWSWKLCKDRWRSKLN